MAQGETTVVAPSYTELERAISSVPGVVEAHVVVSPETGRGRLRIRLAPGEDPEAVSWAVAATLRERFGIALDPEDISVRSVDITPPADVGPQPTADEAAAASTEVQEVRATSDRLSDAAHAALARLHGTIGREGADDDDTDDDSVAGRRDPLFEFLHETSDEPDSVVAVPADEAPPERTLIDLTDELGELRTAVASGGRRRAAIRDLITRHAPQAVEVVATLRLGERDVEGRAQGVPTRTGALRAISEATVEALQQLTGSLLVSVDDIAVMPPTQPESVRVVVSVLDDDGEDALLGAAFVRGDLERAVMRATLDALNRRVEPLLLAAAG